MKLRTFKEFFEEKQIEESWFAGTSSPLKELENKAYKLINDYREMLVRSSQENGEKDDDIHHDIIKKPPEHKDLLAKIAYLFSKVHDYEKDSPNIKPSFFSDTVFERIARYAKRKLGWHADEIASFLHGQAVGDLHHIWLPGSWVRR